MDDQAPEGTLKHVAAELRQSLIDGDRAEAEEDLGLFLTVDPQVARLSSSQVVATISDND